MRKHAVSQRATVRPSSGSKPDLERTVFILTVSLGRYKRTVSFFPKWAVARATAAVGLGLIAETWVENP
jgi:hypothetical protein